MSWHSLSGCQHRILRRVIGCFRVVSIEKYEGDDANDKYEQYPKPELTLSFGLYA